MRSRVTRFLNEERGIVLIVALLVMAALSVLGLAFLMTARTEDAIAVNYRNHTAAFYAAEAGLEAGVVGLRDLLAATPSPTAVQLTALGPPALTTPDYTFDGFQVQPIRTDAGGNPASYQTTIAAGPYAGLLAQTTDYEITAQVAGPRGSRARLSQVVQYMRIPLFQFGAFYGRGVDLEIAPGPPMTFNGRVHANSNLYIRSDGNNARFDSYVTTVGDVYRYLKREPATRGGNPQIMDATGTYQTLNFDHGADYDFTNPWAAPDWAEAVLSTFGGQLLDSAMGVQEIIPPVPDLFYDPAEPDVIAHQMIEPPAPGDSPELQEAKLYNQADLVIQNNQATDGNGDPVNLAPCQAVKTETFYDAREQKEVVATEVDVGALVDCGLAPANGIVYVHKDDGVSTLGGVRLVNGEQLPPGGLTVVSDNPVYIRGDYNTVDKQPAAVLADAITVLSNNWGNEGYDQKGMDVTSERPATATTVNAAFALGPSAESVENQGNGQLENLIRFLEDWNGVNFNYAGSLIALWHSQRATGDWRCCGDSGNNYYRPPNRNWGYDPLFNTQNPPGTPMGIITMRGRWTED